MDLYRWRCFYFFVHRVEPLTMKKRAVNQQPSADQLTFDIPFFSGGYIVQGCRIIIIQIENFLTAGLFGWPAWIFSSVISTLQVIEQYYANGRCGYSNKDPDLSSGGDKKEKG